MAGSESPVSSLNTFETDGLNTAQSQLAEFQEDGAGSSDKAEPSMEEQVAETQVDNEESEEQIAAATQRCPDDGSNGGGSSGAEAPAEVAQSKSKQVAWLQARVVELKRLQAAQILVLHWAVLFYIFGASFFLSNFRGFLQNGFAKVFHKNC